MKTEIEQLYLEKTLQIEAYYKRTLLKLKKKIKCDSFYIVFTLI